MTTTTTNPRLDRMRERVYDGAESVAATLEDAALRIRQAAQRARGRSGQRRVEHGPLAANSMLPTDEEEE